MESHWLIGGGGNGGSMESQWCIGGGGGTMEINWPEL
jgi:hypothetical protein